ncbi:DUF3127 domain-containing protein [Alkalitalea saponilacus]|uniref:DUF3127 domain-containing protein n=1 Tax=Alkalitalea saponilacus TaxID=889453 RepID=A0A1T5G3W6_9BACT|nr:DUF3127 domain-containing protein [Alkalitalea saponilacus]ASB47845.1 hypothetical protein CDL62_01110 [Alkalitalea saponilacus]SKC03009.1 protein of unknown function [Alkalitalea saponilacus]
MNFEISGSLIVKEDTVDITSSFKKREFVIEVINERNQDWNDFIKFQLTQDKCGLLDSYNLGDNIKVGFNLRGRKWEKDGKVNYFTNLEAWRIDIVSDGQLAEPQAPPPFAETDIPPAEPKDDLPF